MDEELIVRISAFMQRTRSLMGNSEAIDSDDTATRAAQTLALISASFEQMIIPMSTGGDLTRDLIGPLTNAVLDACETLTDRIEARVRDSAIGD